MCCAALGFAMRGLAQHIGLRPTSHTPGTLDDSLVRTNLKNKLVNLNMIKSIIKKIKTKRNLNEIKSVFSSQNNLLKAFNDNKINLQLQEKTISFIIIKIKEENFINLKHIPKIINISLNNHGVIDTIYSCFLLVTFEKFEDDPDFNIENEKLKIINTLISEMGNDISIIYGNRKGFYGSYGSEKRMTYGSIISQSSDLINKLLNLKYGSIMEIK